VKSFRTLVLSLGAGSILVAGYLSLNALNALEARGD
jgi:hypothetical protein